MNKTLNKYKRLKSCQAFFMLTVVKLEINYKGEKMQKSQTRECCAALYRITNGSLKKSKRKNFKTLTGKKKNNDQKSIGQNKNFYQKEAFSDTSPPQVTREIPNKQPNLTLNKPEKEESTKSKVSRRRLPVQDRGVEGGALISFESTKIATNC